jgi:ectoine hydroxylase-related dioxygenase (phytanoyl-CoA dioxygenase family)
VLKEAVRNGRLPNGEPAVVGRVLAPDACPAVRRVAHDPTLIAIARGYLGYQPPIVLTELHWSFVTDVSPDYRRQLGQTIDYHYDVGWFNFLYVFFYLTDTDRRSGAHAIIRRSHRRKPLAMLWHSARQPDEPLRAEYGAANELIVEGAAGSGFVEDASCFHKALAPEARERLAFFVRYG